MLTIACLILALHFGRVFAGNVYRSCVAFYLPAADLARTLGKTKTVEESYLDSDGNTHESREVVGDPSQLSRFERVKFFMHLLLAN